MSFHHQADQTSLQILEQTAAFLSKNPPEVEKLLKHRMTTNPTFAFLLEGNPSNAHYQALREGRQVETVLEEPAEPPEDIKNKIEEYVRGAKLKGAEYEQPILESALGNPAYGFLITGNPHRPYYLRTRENFDAQEALRLEEEARKREELREKVRKMREKRLKAKEDRLTSQAAAELVEEAKKSDGVPDAAESKPEPGPGPPEAEEKVESISSSSSEEEKKRKKKKRRSSDSSSSAGLSSSDSSEESEGRKHSAKRSGRPSRSRSRSSPPRSRTRRPSRSLSPRRHGGGSSRSSRPRSGSSRSRSRRKRPSGGSSGRRRK